jgi:GT2 family glycosyltransferase/SAM-dependent methyltransferase
MNSPAHLTIFLVVYEKPLEFKECVRRIYATTDIPFRLIVVVNDQSADSAAIVSQLQQEHDNVEAIFNRENQWCGGGSNQALERVRSAYAVYLCSRECFLFEVGWARQAVDYMDTHPRVGMAGSLSYSPAYATGRDYKIGIPVWERFRRQDYVETRLDDEFAHVQGGFYILRMSMAREIGFLNPAIRHNYIDVEYSYFVEASGWELGELPLADIRHSTTIPAIEGYRPHKSIYHPLTLEAVDDFEHSRTMHARQGRVCGLCGWTGPAFAAIVAPRYRREEASCPKCGSLERHRALIEYLRLTSDFNGRRVLDIAPVRIFQKLLTDMGARYFSADFDEDRGAVRMDLRAAPFASGSFDVILCFHVLEHIRNDRAAIDEIVRLLAPGGRAYVQVPQHRFRHRTVEFDTPDAYCHYHVRDPGLDYYERIERDGVRVRTGDFGSAFPLPYAVTRGISNATGVTAIVDKIA